MELTATRNDGRVELALPLGSIQDFGADFTAEVLDGDGSYALAFHQSDSVEDAVLMFSDGRLGVWHLVRRTGNGPPGMPNPYRFGPSAVLPDARRPVSYSVLAAGSSVAVFVDGAQVARVDTGGSPAGRMSFRTMSSSGALDSKITVRLSRLEVRRR